MHDFEVTYNKGKRELLDLLDYEVRSPREMYSRKLISAVGQQLLLLTKVLWMGLSWPLLHRVQQNLALCKTVSFVAIILVSTIS
jgi:hypothetical protein